MPVKGNPSQMAIQLLFHGSSNKTQLVKEFMTSKSSRKPEFQPFILILDKHDHQKSWSIDDNISSDFHPQLPFL